MHGRENGQTKAEKECNWVQSILLIRVGSVHKQYHLIIGLYPDSHRRMEADLPLGLWTRLRIAVYITL